MIISRTPLRVSLFGGGTDYPQFYLEHEGAILGGSIDKYCYVMLHNGNSWSTFDLPNKSGLASSSAYTVGLLRVCTVLRKKEIAKMATIWEQDKMNGMVGSQDQYLCAVGGFHHLVFNGHGIKDIPVEPKELEKWLLLFDTHQYRVASNIVSYQIKKMKKNVPVLLKMKGQVETAVKLLDKLDYGSFGKLLHEAWMLKRQLSKYVSTSTIDGIYESAIKSGAIGGKLLGGGGGGFIVFVIEPEKQAAVKRALDGLTQVNFSFEYHGTEVIYKDVDSESK